MNFRLTQKLNAKIKAGPLKALPLDENRFADWSASLFVAGRVQFVLVTNTKSLYSMLMLAKGITDDGLFTDRALSDLREFVIADGQEVAFRRHVVPATSSVRFAKALNRSVTGSMNELVRIATFFLEVRGLSPMEVSTEIDETPMSAFGMKDPLFGIPQVVFAAMVSSDS
ncbi:MAG: hypothetical protein WCL32_08655 [Planctomycetota bacterium]